jgi:ketosteroid isomerase-like protein
VTLERNKQIAREFVEASVARDTERVAALMRDDIKLSVAGKHQRFQVKWTKAEWCRYLATPNPFNGGLKLTIISITAEDERVSLESETYGVITASGKIYNNTYHYLFTIKGDQVASMREYMDTEHIQDVLPFPKM